MGQVLVFSLTAMANPTLVAVTVVMLLLPNPKKLMLGYWLGAMTVSITVGLVVVFALKSSSLVHTTKHTISPIVDLALGAIFLVISFALKPGEDKRLEERRARRKQSSKDKGPPRWQTALDKGGPGTAFVVGAVLSLPGASYLAAMDGIIKLKPSTTIAIVLVFMVTLIQMLPLEVVMIAFFVAPDWTPKAIERFRRWFTSHWRRIAMIGTAIVGLLLVIRGVIELLS
jgi:hypothetical protein